MIRNFGISNDIRESHTIPTSFYRDSGYWKASIDRLFSCSWQWVLHESELGDKPWLTPFSFLDPLIPEPLIWIEESSDQFRVCSNVCTHRGNLLVTEPAHKKLITCGYHGRQFDLNGCFRRMPQSQGMLNFPSKSDDLHQIQAKRWKGMSFTGLQADIPFEDWVMPLEDRLSWLPIENFSHTSGQVQKFTIKAHWALYCENYLEGFHIPFVHPELNDSLDFSQYETKVLPFGVLQIGIAKENELCFDLPDTSPDFGKRVAAYYYWLFPNLMLNFYPWGLSVNIVKPISPDQTEIEFRYYIWKEELRTFGAGGALDVVELQDEAIVEQVQKGIQSRFYQKGRYSPSMEQGVHRFHQLLDYYLHTDLK